MSFSTANSQRGECCRLGHIWKRPIKTVIGQVPVSQLVCMSEKIPKFMVMHRTIEKQLMWHTNFQLENWRGLQINVGSRQLP